MCQSQYINELGQQNTRINENLQYSIRKYRYYKRSILRNLHLINDGNEISILKLVQIQPGDLVRVRTRDEINQTLNRYRNTKGCTFFPEMYKYCGRQYKVFKRVDYFFDEVKQKMLKCKGIFLLEGCHCNGKVTYWGGCDRNCLLFWHANWLEKV